MLLVFPNGVERDEKRRDLGIPHLLSCQGISGLTACSAAPGDVSGLILPLLQMRKWRFKGITRLRASSRAGVGAHVDSGGWYFLEQGEGSEPSLPPRLAPSPRSSQLHMPSVCPLFLAVWAAPLEIPGISSRVHALPRTRPPCACRISRGAPRPFPRPRGAPRNLSLEGPEFLTRPTGHPQRTQADPRVLPAAGGPWEPRAAFAAGAGRSAGSRREGLGVAATGWG